MNYVIICIADVTKAFIYDKEDRGNWFIFLPIGSENVAETEKTGTEITLRFMVWYLLEIYDKNMRQKKLCVFPRIQLSSALNMQCR